MLGPQGADQAMCAVKQGYPGRRTLGLTIPPKPLTSVVCPGNNANFFLLHEPQPGAGARAGGSGCASPGPKSQLLDWSDVQDARRWSKGIRQSVSLTGCDAHVLLPSPVKATRAVRSAPYMTTGAPPSPALPFRRAFPGAPVTVSEQRRRPPVRGIAAWISTLRRRNKISLGV